jgi:hypothetical protein
LGIDTSKINGIAFSDVCIYAYELNSVILFFGLFHVHFVMLLYIAYNIIMKYYIDVLYIEESGKVLS